MNVLLISANTETINMPVLPLGMAFVARAAEDAGHKITQVNMMAEPEALKTLPEHIKKVQPDVIGISIRNIDDQNSLQTKFLLDTVKAIIRQCRQHSNAQIVLGGAGYSIFPKSALSYLAADFGIQGEGEQSFSMLLDKLENNEDVSNIPGLYHSEGDLSNLPAAVKDIDQNHFPQPGKHIFASQNSEDNITWMPIQTRRGCPLNCCYCSTPSIEGKIPRKRSPGLVVEALASYIHAGFDHFYFVDNTFNLPPGYSKDLCDRMVESDLNIAWRGILYPGMLDEELVARMAKSGCVEVSLGMESGSDAILRRMNKHYRASCFVLAEEWGYPPDRISAVGRPGRNPGNRTGKPRICGFACLGHGQGDNRPSHLSGY